MVNTFGELVHLNREFDREESETKRVFRILQGMGRVLMEIIEDWKVPSTTPADEEYFARMDVVFRRKRKIAKAMDVHQNAMVGYEDLLRLGLEYVRHHNGDDADTELDADFVKEYEALMKEYEVAIGKQWDKDWVVYRELALRMHEMFRKNPCYDSEMNWEAFRGYAERDIEREAQGVLMERELQGE